MNKPCRVVFINDELENNFYSLKNTDHIKKSIIKAIKNLQQNAFYGTQIPKKLIPKEYVNKYYLTNLWKVNLTKGWRLLYTVTANNEVELIAAILNWFQHKEYEEIMKY